jgi:hypothetical protein
MSNHSMREFNENEGSSGAVYAHKTSDAFMKVELQTALLATFLLWLFKDWSFAIEKLSPFVSRIC